MSVTAAAPRAPAMRIVQLAVLVSLFALFYAARHWMGLEAGPALLIAAVGFLLLAGMLMSEVLDVVGLPHLTGYIAAGVLAGPHVLHMVDHETVRDLRIVGTLALALIALAGGLELKLEELRQGMRTLVFAMLSQSVIVLAAATGLFVLLASYIPFAKELNLGALVGVALIWGVLAISRSPSATLAILAQVKPKGPLTRFSLAFVMSSDVVVVLLMAVTLALVRPLVLPNTDMSLAKLTEVGHEILGSVSLGATLGLLLIIYLRLVGTNILLLVMALGFGLTEGLRYLHFDPTLAFLCAGFVVQNLSRQGPKLLGVIQETGSLVFVVFFATAGAHLDLPLLRSLWPVALALCVGRAVATVAAHGVGARLARDEAAVAKWGWAPLVSQAGLTLGLSVIVERQFPSLGEGFRSLVIATVALNEIIGPILFKLALDRTHESGAGINDPEAAGRTT